MRRLLEFVLDPMVYGLGSAGIFILASYAFPRRMGFVVAGFVIWGIAVGLAAAHERGKGKAEARDDQPGSGSH